MLQHSPHRKRHNISRASGILLSLGKVFPVCCKMSRKTYKKVIRENKFLTYLQRSSEFWMLQFVFLSLHSVEFWLCSGFVPHTCRTVYEMVVCVLYSVLNSRLQRHWLLVSVAVQDVTCALRVIFACKHCQCVYDYFELLSTLQAVVTKLCA